MAVHSRLIWRRISLSTYLVRTPLHSDHRAHAPYGPPSRGDSLLLPTLGSDSPPAMGRSLHVANPARYTRDDFERRRRRFGDGVVVAIPDRSGGRDQPAARDTGRTPGRLIGTPRSLHSTRGPTTASIGGPVPVRTPSCATIWTRCGLADLPCQLWLTLQHTPPRGPRPVRRPEWDGAAPLVSGEGRAHAPRSGSAAAPTSRQEGRAHLVRGDATGASGAVSGIDEAFTTPGLDEHGRARPMTCAAPPARTSAVPSITVVSSSSRGCAGGTAPVALLVVELQPLDRPVGVHAWMRDPRPARAGPTATAVLHVAHRQTPMSTRAPTNRCSQPPGGSAWRRAFPVYPPFNPSNPPQHCRRQEQDPRRRHSAPWQRRRCPPPFVPPIACCVGSMSAPDSSAGHARPELLRNPRDGVNGQTAQRERQSPFPSRTISVVGVFATGGPRPRRRPATPPGTRAGDWKSALGEITEGCKIGGHSGRSTRHEAGGAPAGGEQDMGGRTPAGPLRRYAQTAEALGFDSLWCVDHLLIARGDDRPPAGVWDCLVRVGPRWPCGTIRVLAGPL